MQNFVVDCCQTCVRAFNCLDHRILAWLIQFSSLFILSERKVAGYCLVYLMIYYFDGVCSTLQVSPATCVRCAAHPLLHG